jgi:hypothetical protein
MTSAREGLKTSANAAHSGTLARPAMKLGMIMEKG